MKKPHKNFFNGKEIIVRDAKTGGQKGLKVERYELIPAEPLEEVARLYGRGALKHSDDNWMKGYSWRLSFGAMMRHAWKFWCGEEIDPEMQVSHLACVVFHCFTLMWFCKYRRSHDDRPFLKGKQK